MVSLFRCVALSMLFLGLLPATCFGVSLTACAGVCGDFDRVVAQVRQDPSLARDAIRFLGMIGESRADRIDQRTKDVFGLGFLDLNESTYAYSEIRSAAFRAIGKLGTAEAISYLEKFRPEHFSNDARYELWNAIQVALREAQVNLLGTPSEKIAFLETALQVQTDDLSASSVRHWAANELCERASLNSLPLVAKSLLGRGASSTTEDWIRFCEDRMRILDSNPDAVAALASVLRVEEWESRRRLIVWALGRLAVNGSEAANTVLDQWKAEVAELPREMLPQRVQIESYHRILLAPSGSKVGLR